MRALLAARDSASWPSISRWPSSEFGTSTPSLTIAEPMPVPSVVTMTRPVRPARGAVPHLGEAGGVRVVDDVHLAAGRLREERVGVGADPGLVDVGGRVHDAVAYDAGHGHADRAGAVGELARAGRRRSPRCSAGWTSPGVRIRSRSAAKSPVSRSTGAPLMPVPPKSMPKGCAARHGINLNRWADAGLTCHARRVPTELPLTRHLEGLRAAMVAFVRYADRAGLRAPVPTCPDWTVRDLVAHQGMVHRWAAALLRGERDVEPDRFEAEGRAEPTRWSGCATAHRAGRDADPGAGRHAGAGVPGRRARAARVLGAAAVPRDHRARGRRAVGGARPPPGPGRDLDRDATSRSTGIDELLAGFLTRPTLAAALRRGRGAGRRAGRRAGLVAGRVGPRPAVTQRGRRAAAASPDGDWVLDGTGGRPLPRRSGTARRGRCASDRRPGRERAAVTWTDRVSDPLPCPSLNITLGSNTRELG